MPIISVTNNPTGLIGVSPNLVFIDTNDSPATVTGSGYLTNVIKEGILTINTNESVSGGSLHITCSNIALVNTTSGPIWYAISISGTSPNFIYSLTSPAVSGPSVVTDTTTSATPGTIRAFTGAMTGTATTMTSGNLVGVRGSVNYVGASGGFLYGVQGKLIPTGTLSGSSWNAAVFGQLDISAATINAGQTATLWGDYGTSSHTLTDRTGMYGIAMTNTTAAVLAGQIYLFGGATNLLLLNTNSGGVGATYVTAGGGGAPGGTIKKLAISIDGTTYYLVASTTVT